MKESLSLIRNSVLSSDKEWLAWITSTLNMKTRSNGGRPPFAVLGAVRARHGAGKVRAEQLEVDYRAQPLQRVVLGRQRLQPLVEVEEPGLTQHHPSPSPHPITPQDASRREVLGGPQLNLIQAKRLEPIFESLGRDIEKRADRAMGGIADANKALVAEAGGRATRDLANIASGQVAAHFYLSTYGTLRAYAKALRLRYAVAVFDRTSAETRKIDVAFTALVARIIKEAGNNAYPQEAALYTAAALHPVRTAAAGFALVAAGAATVMALMPPATPAPRSARRPR